MGDSFESPIFLLCKLWLPCEKRLEKHLFSFIDIKKIENWHYCLFSSKKLLKFAYGFAVSIDWETHQLLSKTE